MSGSRIATDIWGNIYGIKVDTSATESSKQFVQNVLGYKWASSYASNTGDLAGMPFYNEMNEECYAVPHPDGIRNADGRGSVWLRYGSSGIPAAVKFNAEDHKAVSVGVPLECLKNDSDRERIFREAFEFFGLYGTADSPGSYQFGFLYFTPSNIKDFAII